jgi:Zn-finger nucleic acid-binding protein
MQCPACDKVTLVMSDRQGIEIDYCPQCRGVWLDRGELDKIIERSAPMEYGAGASAPPPRRSRDYDDDHHGRSSHYRRKKKGFLGELFEFD